MRSVLRRRTFHAALLIVALTAGWSTSAAALPGLPPPPITLTTLTLPTVTVPPVTTPVVTVTAPAVRVPPPVRPAPRAPVPQLPGIPPSAGSPQSSAPHVGTATAPSAIGNRGESCRVGGDETSRDQASRLRLAQDKRTVVVAVRRPTRVELEVREMAPECHLVKRFRAHVHRGTNRLRLGSRPLAPGTYTIVVRSLPTRRVLARARLVVGSETSRKADSCGRAATSAGVSQPGKRPATAGGSPPDPKDARLAGNHRGVLGARFGPAALSSAEDVPLWVYGLLALAVGLLGAAAALPKARPDGLSLSLLAGTVGAAILLGLTIAYSLG